MNIVLINQYAGSIEYGMEFRPYFLAKQWVKQGHQVTIIGASFSHLRRKQPQKKTRALHEIEVVDGIKYVWIKTNHYESNGIGRFLNIVGFVLLLRFLIKKISGPTDLVITSSTHPLDIFPAKALVSAFPECKLIYEPHDLWPMVLCELGRMSRYHPLVLAMQYAEDLSCKVSDSVISMHPQNIEHLVTRGCERSKFYHIPNGVDLSTWETQEPAPNLHSAFISELKQRGMQVVMYLGSVSIANGLGLLLEAAKYLESSQKTVRIVVVGDGSDRNELEARAISNHPNVHFLPSVAKLEVPAVLALADICFVGFVHNPLYRFGMSANKLWDYMMASKPIVLSINSSNDPVKEADCGVTIESGLPIDIAEGISSIAKLSADELKALGQNGNEYVIENNDYEKLARKFLEYAGLGITSVDTQTNKIAQEQGG